MPPGSRRALPADPVVTEAAGAREEAAEWARVAGGGARPTTSAVDARDHGEVGAADPAAAEGAAVAQGVVRPTVASISAARWDAGTAGALTRRADRAADAAVVRIALTVHARGAAAVPVRAGLVPAARLARGQAGVVAAPAGGADLSTTALLAQLEATATAALAARAAVTAAALARQADPGTAADPEFTGAACQAALPGWA